MAGDGGHRGTRAIQRLVEFAPSTGGLALWVRHVDVPAGPTLEQDAPGEKDPQSPVYTDGNTLFYREAFARLPLLRQTGMVAHEVLHVALRHAQRLVELTGRHGDVDGELFNVCADAIVNSALSHLTWLELPPGAVRLEALLAEALGESVGPEQALLSWDVERLYRALDDRAPPPPPRAPRRDGGSGDEERRGGGGRGGKGGRGDGPRAKAARALGEAMAPDLAPGDETRGAPEDEAEATRTWSERLLRGHAGDGAHSMLRALLADLPRVRTPWEQVLRTLLCRSLAPVPGLSWSRPSRSYLANQGRAGPRRRMPWEPGRTASRAVPRLAVIVDVSGSIAPPLLERFARELEAITRRLESDLVLVVGDDQVRRVEEHGPGVSGLREVRFEGGGGTDFTPLLEEAARHRPDIAVVLTDLDGPARLRPRFPVVWAVPREQAHVEAPFGRKLVLDL